MAICAKKPFEAPNPPKPPHTPNFPENLVLPRNPPGIPTESILSAIQNPTEFHCMPLNFPEISRISPVSPEFHQIPEISGKSGEEGNSRNQPVRYSLSVPLKRDWQYYFTPIARQASEAIFFCDAPSPRPVFGLRWAISMERSGVFWSGH